MSVIGKVWFSPSSRDKWWIKEAKTLFVRHGLPFPFDKEHAIEVSTSRVGDPCDPIFTIRDGLSERFDAPPFTRHEQDGAFTHSHIDVQIGEIIKTDNSIVNDFNTKILDILNIATGNMLLSGNILSWNL